MELTLKEWGIVFASLAFLILVVSSVSRYRKRQRETLPFSMGGEFQEEVIDDIDMFRGELPNGGARLADQPTLTPTDVSLQPRTSLHEEHFEASSKVALEQNEQTTPLFESTPLVATPSTVPETHFSMQTKNATELAQARVASHAPSDQPNTPKTPVAKYGFFAKRHQSFAKTEETAQNTSSHDQTASTSLPAHANHTNQPAQSASNSLSGIDKLMIVNVNAINGKVLQGATVVKIFNACGLRLNQQGIFERHEQASGKGPVQFRVANLAEPGIFHREHLLTFRTPGVSFYVQLDESDNPQEAFKYMLETAQCVAKNLNAELFDIHRKKLTPSKISQMKQQVKRFSKQFA